MNKPLFNFQTQLDVGWAGEEFLLSVHDWLGRAMPGERRFDLVDKRPPFKRVEVKTDTYPHEDTPNFFWEKSTTFRNGGYLMGGPWRAARDQVDTLVYLFSNGGTKAKPEHPIGYWFDDVPALVARLDEVILRRPRVALPRRIPNLKVTANGYVVPRDLTADLPGVMMITYVPKNEEVQR